jgi:hypothetical protein
MSTGRHRIKEGMDGGGGGRLGQHLSNLNDRATHVSMTPMHVRRRGARFFFLSNGIHQTHERALGLVCRVKEVVCACVRESVYQIR